MVLVYWNSQSFEKSTSGCYDGGILEISTDGGTSWIQLTNATLLTDPYDGTVSTSFSNPIGGASAWCGDPQAWTRSVVDVSAYAGQTVQFRFRIGSDTSSGRTDGWNLDEIKVQSCSLGAVFAGDFESGSMAQWSATYPAVP